MNYTNEEKIEILKAKKQDCERLITTAFNQEMAARLRIKIKRIDKEIEIRERLLKAFMASVYNSCYRELDELEILKGQ